MMSSSVRSFMNRSSFVDNRRRSSTFRGSMVGIPRSTAGDSIDFTLFDDFDATLGCPLQQYENATLGLVGGKALQCWRLNKHGFPIPNSFIIPTYVYSLHIEKAGVTSIISDLIPNMIAMRNEKKTAGNEEQLTKKKKEVFEKKFAEIREKIMQTPLDDEVVEGLKTFLEALPGGSTIAVRSSASAEDLASQSFAGQYDSFLYKETIDEVVESVKACWSSMFKPHILDYAFRDVFSSTDNLEKDVDEPDSFHQMMNPPKMAVLVMQMIESAKAGVCFTQNLWGETNEMMVEAVYGQCEGLVGGEITPDRYVVDKFSTNLVYQQLHDQTQKFVRSLSTDGVVKVNLEKAIEGPVLSPSNLRVSFLIDVLQLCEDRRTSSYSFSQTMLILLDDCSSRTID